MQKKWILFLAAACFLGAVVAKPKQPRRIVFLIGDGMGLTQISGAMAHYTGRNAFERFQVIGLSKTSSSDNWVTDSGAGATVFSIGKKTFNGAIGVDSLGKESPNLFELIKPLGWRTGVVATSSVTHATPASFYAHVPSRKSEDAIAGFLSRGYCDVAIGGGIRFFKNRSDKQDMFAELQTKGFTCIANTELQTVAAPKLIYLCDSNGMKTMEQGRGDFLAKATRLAQSNLLLTNKKKQYFLMVEGSQIDWGGHDNNFNYMKAELIDFNEVINQVLDEAIQDGNTLVVVTADHETGGLSLIENKENKSTFKVHYSTGGHSGVMVPVFAYGPGAELFSGIYENTEIFHKFCQLMGIKK